MQKNTSLFKILSIDGGGVRGIIPAKILQFLEEVTGQPIHKLFDLIVGTSTGGIITLGLTCPNQAKEARYSAKEIIDIYIEHATHIFQKSFLRKITTGAGLWGAKYDRSHFDEILQQIFGDVLFTQALCPIVIPTYSLLKERPNLFSSRVALENKVELLKMCANYIVFPEKPDSSERINGLIFRF